MAWQFAWIPWCRGIQQVRSLGCYWWHLSTHPANWLIIRAGCPRSARCFSCLRSERALDATPTASATLVGGGGFLIRRRKKARFWRKVSHHVALEYPKTVIRAPLAVVTSGARGAMGQCRLSKGCRYHTPCSRTSPMQQNTGASWNGTGVRRTTHGNVDVAAQKNAKNLFPS